MSTAPCRLCGISYCVRCADCQQHLCECDWGARLAKQSNVCQCRFGPLLPDPECVRCGKYVVAWSPPPPAELPPALPGQSHDFVCDLEPLRAVLLGDLEADGSRTGGALARLAGLFAVEGSDRSRSPEMILAERAGMDLKSVRRVLYDNKRADAGVVDRLLMAVDQDFVVVYEPDAYPELYSDTWELPA